MSIYQKLSPYLFKLDAEKAHNFAGWTLKNIVPLPFIQDFAVSRYCVFDESLHTEVAGMRFYNPIGLAAGFDKNASMVKGLSALGFGFLEIGTITQAPQEGNLKPRLFRYMQERSLQNEMGFNNEGSLKIVNRLKKFYPYSIPIGINVGKNKIIEQSDSLKNYENVLLDCMEVGDYFVFNLSSPNTPHLRDLQNVKFVQELFSMARSHIQKPIFVKISPDMNKDEMLKVVEMAIKCGVSGVIATNTTIDYTLIEGAKQSGGLSGAALKEKSKEVLKILSQAFFGKVAIISVGGIDSAEEAYTRIKLGASLVQVYTALVYQGPKLCKNINNGLLQLLRADGLSNISEAVGYDIANKPKTRKKRASDEADSTSIESAKLRSGDSTQDKQEVQTKGHRGRKKKDSSAKTATTSTEKKAITEEKSVPRKKVGRPRVNKEDSESTPAKSRKVGRPRKIVEKDANLLSIATKASDKNIESVSSTTPINVVVEPQNKPVENVDSNRELVGADFNAVDAIAVKDNVDSKENSTDTQKE